MLTNRRFQGPHRTTESWAPRLAGELDQRHAELTATLERLERDAERGWRRLVEAKGDALAAAVRSAGLTGVIVAQIKGYDAGVRATDIGKVGRHVDRARGAGFDVSAGWWVVNHDRRTRPTERPAPLPGEDDVIAEEVADYNFLLVDTVDLFDAIRDVELGADPSPIRESLLSSTGRWYRAPA